MCVHTGTSQFVYPKKQCHHRHHCRMKLCILYSIVYRTSVESRRICTNCNRHIVSNPPVKSRCLMDIWHLDDLRIPYFRARCMFDRWFSWIGWLGIVRFRKCICIWFNKNLTLCKSRPTNFQPSTQTFIRRCSNVVDVVYTLKQHCKHLSLKFYTSAGLKSIFLSKKRK